jgi:O-methyltransferase
VLRARLGNYIYGKAILRPVKPVLRTLQLMPRRSELGDLTAWRRHAALHRRVRKSGHTMLASRHARDLIRLAEDVEMGDVPGDLVDCGVWNGGSTILLASGAPSRDVWAFDSFEGLPEPTERDPRCALGWRGQMVGSEERLRQGFREYGLTNSLQVVKGWFDETLPTEADRIGRIAVLHIDADWYESVRTVLRVLYPKVSPGGWIAVDDYAWLDGAKLAVDEFRGGLGTEPPILSRHYWRKPKEGAGQPPSERP